MHTQNSVWKQNTIGISVHPDKKLELDILKKVDSKGGHSIGASIALHPEPEHPFLRTQSDVPIGNKISDNHILQY